MLSVDARSLIPIDYTLATEMVYVNAVVAIIASSQSLDLLCDIRIRDDPDWDKRPAMNAEGYRACVAPRALEVLPSKNNQSEENSIPIFNPVPINTMVRFRKSARTQFQQDSEGPWQALISVKVTNSLPSIRSNNKWGSSGSTQNFETLVELSGAQTSSRLDILPRLQVRTHFINVVSHSWWDVPHKALKFADDVSKDPSRLSDTEYSWILSFFRRRNGKYDDSENVWSNREQGPIEHISEEDPNNHIVDMEEFCNRVISRVVSAK